MSGAVTFLHPPGTRRYTVSAVASPPSKARIAVAVAIGNFMEWFDFAVYGFFAVIIGQLFFPADTDPFVAILSSLGVFAVGFFIRPLGGFILGPIGDRYGRRTALAISVLAMGSAPTIIGLRREERGEGKEWGGTV